MRLFLSLACFFSLCIGSIAFAQEDASAGIKQSQLPVCNDPQLLRQISEKIASYYQKHQPKSLIEKRQRSLVFNNLKSLHEKNHQKYLNKEHRQIANKIATIKISEGLSDDELRLCSSSKNDDNDAIYILIHPQNYHYLVEIINFVPGSKEDFFVIYN